MTRLGPHAVELVGFVAAFCTTTAFVPQLLRVVKLRSAREISPGTFLLFSQGWRCGLCTVSLRGRSR
jgi:MtN3 and saliva related transmembrane protein